MRDFIYLIGGGAFFFFFIHVICLIWCYDRHNDFYAQWILTDVVVFVLVVILHNAWFKKDEPTSSEK